MKFKQLFKLTFLCISILFFQNMAYGQKYKDMINNNTINFYDVV